MYFTSWNEEKTTDESDLDNSEFTKSENNGTIQKLK